MSYTLIATESFSSVSSVSVDNVFSSTYLNYQIVGRSILSGAASETLSFRLRSGGSDNSTTYESQQFNMNNTVLSSSRYSGNDAAVALLGDSYVQGFTLDLYRPFVAEQTVGTSLPVQEDSSGNIRVRRISMIHKVSSSFDGFTLFVSNTITGQFSVYGYES